MKKNWIKLAGAALALLAVNATVQATPINGSIGFAGTYTQNGTAGDLTTATSLTINTANILTASGAFSGATLLTFYSPIGVNPANNLISPSAQQLWSVKVGATTYDLLVSTESETKDTSSELDLVGTGTIQDGIAADNTAGSWTLQFGASGAAFTWNSTSTSVPDGGTTAMLLGGALVGLGLLKRKLMA